MNLNDNRLTGRIPSTLGNLVNLRKLELANNQLTSFFPNDLGNLRNLELLRINDNFLSGALQISLIRLRALEEFYFHNNAGPCASSDDRVQNWLQSIDRVQGPTCDDFPQPPDPTSPIPAGCNPPDLQRHIGRWHLDKRLCLPQPNRERHTLRQFFSFSVSRSATYDLTLESPTDTYLILLDAEGDIIKEDDDDHDGAFGLRSRSSGIRIPLEPGNYIVEATTYAGTATGDFTLTIIHPELAALPRALQRHRRRELDEQRQLALRRPLYEWHGVTEDDSGRVTNCRSPSMTWLA